MEAAHLERLAEAMAGLLAILTRAATGDPLEYVAHVLDVLEAGQFRDIRKRKIGLEQQLLHLLNAQQHDHVVYRPVQRLVKMLLQNAVRHKVALVESLAARVGRRGMSDGSVEGAHRRAEGLGEPRESGGKPTRIRGLAALRESRATIWKRRLDGSNDQAVWSRRDVPSPQETSKQWFLTPFSSPTEGRMDDNPKSLC